MIELTAARIKMLVRLDDGPIKDSVGLRVDDFSREDHETLRALLRMGLVLIDIGWRDCVWCRLSPEGRRTKTEALAGK